jgi:hypothetical protein
MSRDFGGIVIVVILFVVLSFLFIFLINRNEKNRIEKGCDEYHHVYISSTFKCSEGKQYIHVSMIGKQANVTCCEKE